MWQTQSNYIIIFDIFAAMGWMGKDTDDIHIILRIDEKVIWKLVYK